MMAGFGFQAQGQYESFFGHGDKKYAIAAPITCYMTDGYDPCNLGYCITTDNYVISSDTAVFNGITYFRGREFANDLFVREDTLTGRIYRYSTNWNEEYLVCDMSLSVGDSFLIVCDYLSNWDFSYEDSNYLVVDSVYFFNGKKIIQFNRGLYDFSYRKITFIEGVGPSYGPFGYTENGENSFGLLLCISQVLSLGSHEYSNSTDSLIYMLDPDLGCWQDCPWGIREHAANTVRVYPNPAGNAIYLEMNDLQNVAGDVYIFNSMGQSVHHQKITDSSTIISVSHLPKGLYVIFFLSPDVKANVKFIKQ